MAKKPGTQYYSSNRRTLTETYVPSRVPAYQSSTVFEMITREQDSLVSFFSSKGDYSTPNPHSFQHVRHMYPSGTTVEYSKTGTSWSRKTMDGQVSGGPAYFPGVDDSLQTEAYNKALNSYYDQVRGTIDLAVDIAEAGQTAGMLRNTAKLVNYVLGFRRKGLHSLEQDYRDFMRYYRKGGLRWAKDSGSKWLEFQYGWKPLAQTIYNCASKVIDDTPRKATVRARAHASRSWQINRDSIQNKTERVNVESLARAQVFGQFNLKPSVLNTLAGYTSLNPASIVWELTPYSFVVDWVYDIGGYIRNLESALISNVIFEGGYAGIGYQQKSENVVSQSYDTGSFQLFQSLKGNTTLTGFTRTKLTAPPLPRPPQFQADLGSGRLLNAAALLSQFLGVRKR